LSSLYPASSEWRARLSFPTRRSSDLQEFRQIVVENVQINRTCTRTLAELVGIAESALQSFCYRQYPFCHTFNAFDRFTARTQFGQIDCHTAADLAQLFRSRVDIVDRVQAVIHFKQEA